MGAPKKFKNWPRPLFWPRTDDACPQKPNPSRETVPLNFRMAQMARRGGGSGGVGGEAAESPADREINRSNSLV